MVLEYDSVTFPRCARIFTGQVKNLSCEGLLAKPALRGPEKLTQQTRSVLSGKYRFHDFAMDVRESETAALVAEGQFFVVNPQQVQQRGMEVMH